MNPVTKMAILTGKLRLAINCPIKVVGARGWLKCQININPMGNPTIIDARTIWIANGAPKKTALILVNNENASVTGTGVVTVCADANVGMRNADKAARMRIAFVYIYWMNTRIPPKVLLQFC